MEIGEIEISEDSIHTGKIYFVKLPDGKTVYAEAK